jgi:hypothetical protein
MNHSQTFRSRHCNYFLVAAIVGVLAVLPARCAEWQWSVPMGNGRAFLWIPPNCKQVRAVVVGQNNMIKQGILERQLGSAGNPKLKTAAPVEREFFLTK